MFQDVVEKSTVSYLDFSFSVRILLFFSLFLLGTYKNGFVFRGKIAHLHVGAQFIL